MDYTIPATAKSWVLVDPDSHFPIQNLPFGMALNAEGLESIVTRIGDHVIDIAALAEYALLSDAPEFFLMTSLADLGKSDLLRIRAEIYELFREDNPILRDQTELWDQISIHVDDAELVSPFQIPAFVDFYSGIHHASNVGKMFRPDMPPLLPNYRHMPIAYNGRASTVVISGTPIPRPSGQTKGENQTNPTFGPTKELDFELELGFFLIDQNESGEPISTDDAEDHILGLVLVNDWSARDVQRWEYQPLGPFLAKSFRTSISPWVVVQEALEPFRIPGPKQEPEVLPYLRTTKNGHYDLQLEVAIQTPSMTAPQVICRTNSKHLYWNFAQQLAHVTSNGTDVEVGDLYASGTISGPEAGSFGSLLELTWRGEKKIVLTETGEERTFLEDGDTVIISGYGQGKGYRVGFGELVGQIIGE
jgi:fumarylacetoacetase